MVSDASKVKRCPLEMMHKVSIVDDGHGAWSAHDDMPGCFFTGTAAGHTDQNQADHFCRAHFCIPAETQNVSVLKLLTVNVAAASHSMFKGLGSSFRGDFRVQESSPLS